MADQQGTQLQMPDPAELSKSFAEIAERTQSLLQEWMSKNGGKMPSMGMEDPLSVGNTFMELTAKMMADPSQVVKSQMSLWQDYMALWQNTASRMMGQETEPFIKPAKEDRRFKDPAWEENDVFNYIKQSYLLASRWMQQGVNEVPGVDEKTREKADFYTRQFVSALSPTNFAQIGRASCRERV